jgi:energy-coupling factor transporter ATP-binding protein EcfA2
MNLIDLYQQKYDELYDTGPISQQVESFKLPIQYIQHTTINSIIKTDLEMPEIYKNLVGDSILLDNWSSYYTTNKNFLKDSQSHISSMPKIIIDNSIVDSYKKFKSETSFIEKYQYIGLKMLRHFNYSPTFLHGFGLYNLASPVISLFTPILVLIVPFIILKMKGIPITISIYIEFLKTMMQRNSIYTLFTKFNEIGFQQKMSAIVTIMFYFFQIYSNIMSCISFYKNIHTISAFLEKYREHIKNSIENMNHLQSSIQKYKSYIRFYEEIENHKIKLSNLYNRLKIIYPFKNTISRITQLGIIMNLNYEIFMDKDYNDSFMFSIYINQYIHDINSMKSLVKKKIHKCKFRKNTKIEGMYYLPHINESPVLNNIDLSQNIMITGPNASGKTTILKSLLINLLMSQQFGYGCYKKAQVKVYDIFHSYLNIPDTSGRDSLFQAEARRCKDILVSIVENANNSHCCIFDEIYSGTNPTDAVSCATMYLEEMNKYKVNVDYVLTTHYIELCELFDKKEDFDKICNLKMNVNVLEDSIEYLYKIENGISYVHGGKQVLKDLKYPLILNENKKN